MITPRNEMTTLAGARPRRLDPEPGSRPDPALFTAHPQPTAGRVARRPSRRLVLAGVAPTVAVVAAGAIFLTVGSTSGGAGPEGGLAVNTPTVTPTSAADGPAPRTARELLLVAAERSATADAATSGRYRVVEREHGSLFQVGPKDRRYQVVSRTSIRDWHPTSPSEVGVSVSRELGAAPFSADDRAAWQADGSPTRWVEPSDPPQSEPTVISGTPGPEFVRRATSPEPAAREAKGPGPTDDRETYYLAGGPITAAGLADVPTDPAKLKAWLSKRLNASEIESATDFGLFSSAKNLVFDLPVSPKVRAAAYQMLADVRGVTSLGAVTDQRGRAGMAVAFARKGDGGNWVQTRLIIDHRTGQALAEESWDLGTGSAPKGPGTFTGYTLVVSAAYTNDDPPAVTPEQKRR
ncbi:CU044_5270 family protein [Micromonospora sp. NPDC047670]|uniref:CU044_5270 family protein n=1 Tax=Micromonospora sp. NPDC047670 TaxID=3364252 RepID=UPI00371D45B1